MTLQKNRKRFQMNPFWNQGLLIFLSEASLAGDSLGVPLIKLLGANVDLLGEKHLLWWCRQAGARQIVAEDFSLLKLPHVPPGLQNQRSAGSGTATARS
jgi:hypothetical protein